MIAIELVAEPAYAGGGESDEGCDGGGVCVLIAFLVVVALIFARLEKP